MGPDRVTGRDGVGLGGEELRSIRVKAFGSDDTLFPQTRATGYFRTRLREPIGNYPHAERDGAVMASSRLPHPPPPENSAPPPIYPGRDLASHQKHQYTVR